MKNIIIAVAIFFSFYGLSFAEKPIRVVTSLYEPFVYYDENGRLTGFDVDLLNKICERLNLTYSIEVVPFHEIIAKLSNNEADIAIGAIYATKERKKIVNFSEDYLETLLVFIGNKDDEFTKDFTNKKIGVKKGATGEILAKKISQKYNNCEVIPFETTEDSIEALVNKKVDVAINDFINTNWLMFKKFRGKIFIPKNILDIPIYLSRDKIAFPISKHREDLLKKFNSTIIELKKEGYITRLKDANPYIPDFPNLIKIAVGITVAFLLLICIIFLVYRNLRNKEKLRISISEERKLKSLLNSFPNLVILHNQKGEIIYNNRKAEDFGLNVGENLFDFFNSKFSKSEQKDLIKKKYDGLFQNKKPFDVTDISVVNKKGEHSIWEVNSAYVEDSEKSDRYLSYIQDVTYIKEMERQFFQMQKMESIGRLTAGIAHDFNNSLAAILGFTELSKIKIDDKEEVAKNLDKISSSIERASSMVKKLLAFSRPQLKEIKKVNINDFIENMKEVMGKLVGEDIKIHIDLKSHFLVQMDPSQFEQILINLLVNAKDAMPNGGTITIKTKDVHINDEGNHGYLSLEKGDYVLMIIEDTGIGMTEEIKSRVFDPFFTTKKDKGGSGLGLSTVYAIVKQSKGEIVISSQVAVGTAVSIYLPALKEEDLESEKISYSKTLDRTNFKVLLVEDDEMIREAISKILKERGFLVLIAKNGKEGLKTFDENRDIPLIISDIKMPELSGLDMFKEIYKINPSVKCLLITGYSDCVVDKSLFMSSNVSILYKPFTANVLEEKLKEILK